MKKIFYLCTLCISLLLTSCGVSRSNTSNTTLTQTHVELSKKNFRVIGTVYGENVQTYWFGIGGLSRKSMDETAITDMYMNANLTGSQVIINTNVSHKNKWILFYSQTKAIATGTIIEFTE